MDGLTGRSALSSLGQRGRIAAPRWPTLVSRIRFGGLRRLSVGGNCRPSEDVPAGRLLHFAPLRRSDPHVTLEGALERRLGLVPHRLRHGAGGKGRSLQFVRCEHHPDVSQKIAGRSSELLLKLSGGRGPRHVAPPRQVRERPCPRRLVEKGGPRRCKAGMTRERKETSRGG